MAATFHNDIFDMGLSQLTTIVENLYICSAMPTTFAEASSTYKLGTKASPTITGPADRTGGGREVTVAAITDGVVNADGTAGFYALCDNSASKLLVAQALSATQVVTSGNPFSLAALKVGMPDPTAQ